MFKNKKANFPLLKTVFMLLTSTLIIIIYLIALHQMQTIYINDKKTRTQIIESKILSNCFSDEFAMIENDKFTQETLNNCINSASNMNVKVLFGNTDLYLGSKSDYESKLQFCSSSKSNILCTKMKYPVIIKNSDTDLKQSILTLYIIAS